MRLVLACVLVLVTALSATAAPPDRVSIHLGSRHVNAQEEFEEFNSGLFLSWDRSFSYTFGAFQNSYGDVSVAATMAFPVLQRPAWRMNFFAGWAYYPDTGRNFRLHHGDVVPVAGLRVYYRHLFVQFLPGDGQVADAVFSFGLTFPFRVP
ncbi:MAG: hypothetical protein AAFO80_07895 [Pseudomonadota bacterium]